MTLRPFLVLTFFIVLVGAAEAQERQWSLDASDQDAYLIFGVPDSDDVGISFWCPIRQGEVNVFVPEAGERLTSDVNVPLTITAGSAKAELTGRTEVNAEAGTASVESKIPVTHPIFAALKSADRFKVKADGEDELVVPVLDADFGGLLDLCRKE